MAGDPFRRVNPGDQMAIPAAAWNALLDLAREDRPMSAGRRPPRQFVEPTRSAVVYVQNETGGTVGRFGVLALGDPVILPSERQEQFERQVAFKGHVPGEDTPPGRFCVLQEILAYNGGQGSIGRAVLAGLTIVKLFTSGASVDHPFAECAANDAARLQNVATGTARVVWSQADENAVAIEDPEDPEGPPLGYERWAVVRLGDGSGGDGAGGVTVTNLTTNYGSPVTISTSTNNLTTPPTYGNVLVVTNTPNLTGIVAGVCGQRLLFVNGDGGTYLVLRNEDAGSDPANRFRTPYEQDLIIPPDFAFELLYDCEIDRWRVLWVSDILNPGTDQPATISTDQDDYVFDFRTPTLTLDLGANVNFTGFFGGVEGYLLRISTIYTTPDEWVLTLKHLDAGSDAANQIVTPGGVDFRIASGGGFYLYYGNGKWRVLATHQVHTTPNKLIAVGANKLPEEKAQLEIDGQQLKVIRNDGAGRPEMAMIRRGSSDSNLGGGEDLGGYSLKGRIDGTDKTVAGVEGDYGGTGTEQTGSLKLFAYGGGVKNVGMTVHDDGDAEFTNANTANKYLGTDASGRVVTKDAAATLTETYVGFGDATDSLTGDASFTFDVSVAVLSITTDDAVDPYLQITQESIQGRSAPAFWGRAARAGLAAVASGDELFSVGGQGHNGTNYFPLCGIVGVATDATHGRLDFFAGDNSNPTVFQLMEDGSVRVPGLTASQIVLTDADKDLTTAASLAATLGGTGLTTYTTGDLIYASAANTLAKLTAGTEGRYLRQGASVPAWTYVKGEILDYEEVMDDESTSSTSYVDLATTHEVSFTLESVQDVLIEFEAYTYNPSVSNTFVILRLDGSNVTASERAQGLVTGNVPFLIRITYRLSGLSAAAHTVRVRVKTDAGTVHLRERTLKASRL